MNGEAAPDVGDLVYDEERQRLGRVTAVSRTGVMLRPVGGGEEWRAAREEVREPRASERLGPRLAQIYRPDAWGKYG